VNHQVLSKVVFYAVVSVTKIDLVNTCLSSQNEGINTLWHLISGSANIIYIYIYIYIDPINSPHEQFSQ